MKNRNEKEVIENVEVKEEPVVEEPVVKQDTPKARPKKYIITVTNLALRDAPNGERIGVAPSGLVLISEVDGEWGKLSDNSGWVNMNYTRKAD